MDAKKPVDNTVDKPKENLQDANQDDIVNAIAEILQIPPETIMQWLAELNLQPVDLTDTQAVVELLKIAFDTPDTTILLNLPEFSTVYKAINEAINMLKPELMSALFAVLTSDETLTTHIPNLEGLQVDDSNREIIVTSPLQQDNLMTEEDVYLQSSNQSTAAGKTQAVSTAANQSNTGSGFNAQTSQGNHAPDITQADMLDIPLASTSFESVAARVAEAVEAVRSQTNTPVNATDVINQIMGRVRAQAGENFTEIRIMLKPENLGDVTLRVLTQNGIVTAQFVAESQRVKEVLESNFNQLRDALSEQGVQISELSVSVRQSDEERMNQFAQAQQNSRARMQRINNVNTEETQETGFGDDVDPSAVHQGTMNFIA